MSTSQDPGPLEVGALPGLEPRGRFITFEGGDGSGKSTQAKRFAERLGAELSREPGGTAIGAVIRGLVLDPAFPELGDRTEALLMAADRAQHVSELIEPSLASGRDVVSDRHVASSLAYQGVGRGLGIEAVQGINDFAVNGLVPDLVVLLDLQAAVARDRLPVELDRIESSGASLAIDVAESYRKFAEADPQRWVVVDANGSIDEVADRVWSAVSARIGGSGS